MFPGAALGLENGARAAMSVTTTPLPSPAESSSQAETQVTHKAMLRDPSLTCALCFEFIAKAYGGPCGQSRKEPSCLSAI